MISSVPGNVLVSESQCKDLHPRSVSVFPPGLHFSLLLVGGITAVVMFKTREQQNKDPNAEAPSEELQKLRKTYTVALLQEIPY